MQKVGLFQLWILSLFVGSLGSNARAADESLPPKLRVAVLFKTLTYDHKLEAKRPDGLRIAVVIRAGDAASQADGAAIAEAMQTFADKKVKGLTLFVEPIAISSAKQLEALIAEKGCNAMYLGTNLGELADQAIVHAKARGLVVLTGESEAVRKGAAIGAVQRAGKPWILVNLKAATAQGAEMDSRLLRFVEVVE